MPTRWIDFRALKRQVPIREVLARYGFLDGLKEGKQGKLSGPCPIHGGGPDSNSFHVDPAKNVWNCFSTCSGGGNVLDLVMKIEDVTIREAAEQLTDWFGLSFDREQHPKTEQHRAGESPATAGHTSRPAETSGNAGDVINPPLERSLTLNHDHKYLFTRGLTVATIKAFGVGYCNRGLMRGRIAIPIHNEDGEIAAYAGRAVDQELADKKGKYRLPSNFSKSHVVWNLNRACVNAERGLVVVEGFFGAMKVHQAGFPNVVSLMGSTLSERQEELLVANAERLVVLLDGDDAGRTCERDVYRRLRTKLFLKSVHLADGEQPDALSEDRLRELLS